jgi:hypothetical protein
VIMDLFINRSVKISDLAAMKNQENQHSTKAARSLILTDQVFNSSQTQNLG